MSKNLKAGIIALISLIGGILLINFLKGKHFFNQGIVLYAIYENVNGLEATKPVMINGMKVGRVNNIRFTDDASGKLLVEMTINSQFKFDKNTKAVIYEPDLMSGAQIKLELSRKGPPVKEGDYLIGVATPNLVSGFSSKIIPLKDKLESVLVNMDSTLTVIRGLVNAKNEKGLAKLIENLDTTISSYHKVAVLGNKTIVNFNHTVESINALSTEAKGLLTENRIKVSSILSRINTTLDGINQMVKKLNQAAPDKTIAKLNASLNNLNEIINKIKKGKGSLGKFVENESVYNNLEQASRELNLLLKDLRENPKRYVHFSIFGKKNKPYEGEKTENDSKK